ncbi:MAG: response regulator transcription factor, partial [Verrucomicrobia bacterium]|nr:response regulator transcription factor [Verrucomicrobiota bacterium]
MTTPHKNKRIRTLLADDHAVVRLGLKAMLNGAVNIEIVGEAGTASAAVAETARLKPDVVLLDIRLPDGCGFEACRQIQKMEPAPRVVFLTAFSDDETVFEGISAGADGYLLKGIEGEQLMRALENVMAGQSVLDPIITKRVLGRVRSAAEPNSKDKLELLSAQERRVIALVAEGKTNKEIGLAMGLSDKTVKNYFSNTLDKLKLTRRAHAA